MVLRFSDLRRDHIEPSRSATTQRHSLRRAAESLLELFDSNPKVAVLGVPAATTGDIADIYSYLVEPAYRRDVTLLLGVDRDFVNIENSLIEPEIGYPWSRERLTYIAERYQRAPRTDGLPPLTPIEDRLLSAMRSVELRPEVQYGIGRFRVDFAFPEVRLAIEADGRAWHDVIKDAARDNRLKSMGWDVLRFTGSRIHREATQAAEEIAARLEHRRSAELTYSDIDEEEPRRSWWQRFLDWLFRRNRARQDDTPDGSLPEETAEIPAWKIQLDDDQLRAVNAAEGVVQIIAPAGSGKTMTVVARVQELISRGVPANRILCTTFNRASVEELDERLKISGVAGPDIKSFHALGWMILNEEDVLRKETGLVTYAQLRRIAKLAMDEIDGGEWIDAPASSELISDYKLAKMWTPADARRHASNATEETAAEIYRIYEEQLEEADRNDFDDLIIRAVRLLQESAETRMRWQERWESVLIDEFQDIEPAQELLIRVVAAPEDSIFAVGDEDQCIYSWRRASVERIVMLDTAYPGLERVILKTSYRCPQAITEVASRLISLNKRRFPKTINPSPVSNSDGHIRMIQAGDVAKGAEEVVTILRDVETPDETVVLARTSRQLRDLVRACVDARVPVRAPANALHTSDAERTILAYIRLASSPQSAIEEDIRQSFRVPNRYLPRGSEQAVENSLRAGASFRKAAGSVPIPSGEEWRTKGITEWAELLADLAGQKGSEAVKTLRGDGGLDQHYSSVEKMTPHDQIEIEALDDLSEVSQDKSLVEMTTLLEQRSSRLQDAVDEDGVELATIHGAKGREWETVILFGADADQLPHNRALADAENDAELEEAIEDERRLAYVAMTRTKKRLVVVSTGDPSPFLREAGITSSGVKLPTLQSIKEQRAETHQTETSRR